MRVRYKQAETMEELEQILGLQRKNLAKTLSREEREREGFVTVEHNRQLLREMNRECGHIIALAGEELIGYALYMHPRFSDRIEVLRPMFTEIEGLVPKLSDHMIMGQICVAKGHRGKGVFRNLYRTMGECLPQGFESIITEVDGNNRRSLAAHAAIGFRTLGVYHHQGKEWHIVQWVPTAKESGT